MRTLQRIRPRRTPSRNSFLKTMDRFRSVTILDVSTPVTKRVFLTALSAGLALASAFGTLLAQTMDGTPFRIERLHPSLDDLVSPAAQLELLGDRFALTEGPVWVRDGQD